MTDARRQIAYSYVLTVVGVALMATSTLFGAVRATFARKAFAASAGFSNSRFGMNPFGLANALTILAMLITIVGLVWLGLNLRKSPKATTS